MTCPGCGKGANDAVTTGGLDADGRRPVKITHASRAKPCRTRMNLDEFRALIETDPEYRRIYGAKKPIRVTYCKADRARALAILKWIARPR